MKTLRFFLKTLNVYNFKTPLQVQLQHTEVLCTTSQLTEVPRPARTPLPQLHPMQHLTAESVEGLSNLKLTWYESWRFCFLGNSTGENQNIHTSSRTGIFTIQHDTHLLHMDCCSTEEYFYLSFCVFYLRQMPSLSPTSLHFQWPHSRSKKIPSNFIFKV